ncbi:MAG: RNA polymerase sigma factor [Calditrichia bacterium]|nr:RNA polymerase sigma factor [Calditrichia bacterium]
MDPDRQLVRLAKNGNKAAFGKLARRYRDGVLALAYDFLNDYENAQDVAQNVFMKAFKNIGDFEEKSRFSSWLFRITVNASLDARKSKIRRRKFLIKKEVYEKNGQVSAQPEWQDGIDDTLINALNKLSDHQQTAIILRYFHDKSVREIADVLDCSESTVRIHLHRAIQKLDKSLKKRK